MPICVKSRLFGVNFNLTELRVKGGVTALGKDSFLSTIFRKVQKIGKELKSNGTSTVTGFFSKEINSRDLEKTKRIALV